MIKILTADELAKKTAKGTITTIYGLPDSGKSTFMVTVAKKMRVLFIDAEGKFGKICQNVPGFDEFKKNISGIEVKTLKDLIAVVQDPLVDNFDAIVIDSVTQLVDKELHDIMFVQKRSRTFSDYNDLGTNFMGAIEILKEKGISTFFTIQAKKDGDYSEPDAQGNMVAKKAIEASDWMFFIQEAAKGARVLSIKNSLDCRLKKKGVPEKFADQLVGEEVNFSSLWEIFPSKPEVKAPVKKATKAQITKIEKGLALVGEKRGKPVEEKVFLNANGLFADKIKDVNSEEAVVLIDSLNEKLKSLKESKK